MYLAHVVILVVMATITDALDRGCLSPKFRVKPTHDAVTIVGGTHQFRCIVRGRPAPNIKWFSKNKIVYQKKNVMVGKNTLTISNIKKSDEGAYACLATNDHGFVWGNFTLKVVSNKDRIGSQPKFRRAPKQNVVAFVDGLHKFLCKVKGSPKPNLVWYHKNKMLSSNGDVKIRKYSLKISELKKSDGGAYACKASNIHGVIWGNFTLRILNNEDLQNILFGTWLTEKDATAPIMEGIKNQTTLTGTNVTFTCQIVMSDYQPLVQWIRHFKKNNKGEPYVTIVQSSEFKSANDDPQHLIIRNVTKRDEGWYTCLVVNSAGMNSRSAWLTVLNDEVIQTEWYDYQDEVDDTKFDDLKGPPDFTRRSHVRFLAKTVNSSIVFDCAFIAFPVAEIIWLKNGIPMKEKNGKYIFNRYTLTVKYLTREDNGNYTCEVRNEYGSINRTVRLVVQKEDGFPPIMEDVRNQTALAGTNVTFTCQIVMSGTQPLLQWLRHIKKNDSYVNEKGEPYLEVLKSAGFKKTIDDPQHVVLRNVTKEDEGWYTCLVANTVGMNYRSAWLTVLNETEYEELRETDKSSYIWRH